MDGDRVVEICKQHGETFIPTPIARELQRMIKVLVPARPWLRLGWRRAFVRLMFFSWHGGGDSSPPPNLPHTLHCAGMVTEAD